jgi:hypothetical protein
MSTRNRFPAGALGANMLGPSRRARIQTSGGTDWESVAKYWHTVATQKGLAARPAARPAPRPQPRRAAPQTSHADAIEIARACEAAARPELAADFIMQGRTADEVRAVLAPLTKPPTDPSDASGLIRHAAAMMPSQIERMWDDAFSRVRAAGARTG